MVAVGRTPFGRFGGALSSLPAPARRSGRRRGVGAPASRRSVDALYAGVRHDQGRPGPGAGRQPEPGCPTPRRRRPPTALLLEDTTQIGTAWKGHPIGVGREVVLCGGFESLSNTPFLWPRRRRPARPSGGADPLVLRRLPRRSDCTRYWASRRSPPGSKRDQQDEWALRSRERYWDLAIRLLRPRAVRADDCGRETSVRTRSPFGSPRVSTLSSCRPSTATTVTAGNAPGLNDGAAMLVLVG